jgi:hypothetical protein
MPELGHAWGNGLEKAWEKGGSKGVCPALKRNRGSLEMLELDASTNNVILESQ